MRGLWARVWPAAGVLALTATTGCSAHELAAWVAWHDRDPVAAVEFARRPDVTTAFESRPVEQAVAWSVNWDRVAWCESGGRWDHPPVTNRHGTFSGGLMWNHRYWDAFGGERYADHPWQATKAEQIAISEQASGGSLAEIDRMFQCYP